MSTPRLVAQSVEAPLPPRLAWSALALPGLRSLKRNWPAIVGLQAAGLAVVVAYYASGRVRAACDALAAAKAAGGVWAAAGLMAFACGVVPEAAKTLFGIDRTSTAVRWRTAGFNVLLYALVGVLVDAFYAWQAVLFGAKATVGTVLAKVAFDQFGYTPVLGVTVVALAYTWREYRYGLRRTFAALGPHWYVTRSVILLLPNWAYWLPMTLLMYALPPALTFVFGVAASAAAALLLTTIAAEASASTAPPMRA